MHLLWLQFQEKKTVFPEKLTISGQLPKVKAETVGIELEIKSIGAIK